MRKKIKFFDSICFSGDVEFLNFRLTELDPYVDYFIIADFVSEDSESSFLNYKHLFFNIFLYFLTEIFAKKNFVPDFD